MKIYDPVIDLKRYSQLMFEIREKIVIIGKTDIGQIVLYESEKEADIDKVFLEQLKKITSEDNKKFCLLNIKSEDSVIKDLSQFTIFVLEDGEKLELSDTLKKIV